MDSLLFYWNVRVAGLTSAILSRTIIAALLAQQIRQIGAMKAVGARNPQISGCISAGADFWTGGLVVGSRQSGVGRRMPHHRRDVELQHTTITSLWVYVVKSWWGCLCWSRGFSGISGQPDHVGSISVTDGEVVDQPDDTLVVRRAASRPLA